MFPNCLLLKHCLSILVEDFSSSIFSLSKIKIKELSCLEQLLLGCGSFYLTFGRAVGSQTAEVETEVHFLFPWKPVQRPEGEELLEREKVAAQERPRKGWMRAGPPPPLTFAGETGLHEWGPHHLLT